MASGLRRASPPPAARGGKRDFGRDDDGAVVTVGFVLWIPLFLVICAVTVDAAILLLANANMWSVARDTARRMAVNDRPDAGYVAEARQDLLFDSAYDIATRRVDGGVEVTIRIKVADASLFGVFDGVGDLDARVTMRRE